ncbi:MAG: PqqD family protein [Myxococcota bacterium]|nr:PqqD family protein [Myxococcota bacterium]
MPTSGRGRLVAGGARRVALRRSVAYAAIDDREGVILDIERRRHYLLNEAASLLIGILDADGESDVETLVERLVHEYAVGRRRAAEHVEDMLAEMDRRGLVRITRLRGRGRRA